jgi:hypothetical protein
MITRSIKIALITAGLAAAPMLSMAGTAPAAMDSCVKAFMANLSTTMAKPPKLQASRLIDDQVGVLVAENSTELTLMARDAHDHHPIARAQCTVNSAGQVIDLHQEPLDRVDAL